MKKIVLFILLITSVFSVHAQPSEAVFTKNGQLITTAQAGIEYELIIFGTNCDRWKPISTPQYTATLVSESATQCKYAITFTNVRGFICEVKVVSKQNGLPKILHLGYSKHPCVKLL